MYVPAQFRNQDVVELKRLMRAHKFATLVTTGPDAAPFATHLPLLLEDDPADANVIWLRSHMARANPQWRHFFRWSRSSRHFPRAARAGPFELVRFRAERADLELRGRPRLRSGDGA